MKFDSLLLLLFHEDFAHLILYDNYWLNIVVRLKVNLFCRK